MWFIAIISVIIILFFCLFGGKELVGEWITGLFPADRLKKGDKVGVFLDGKYNRTATITGITQGGITIYDKLPLPVDYRGKFYAIGVDRNDGSKLVYIKNRKFYKFIRAAEFVRKAFSVLDDAENLMPDEPVIAEAATIGAAETETETEEDGDDM